MTDTKNLQKIAQAKFDFNVAKKLMLERVDAQSTFTFAGGLFKANAQLLATIANLCPDSGETPLFVLILDEFDNPIYLDLQEFRKKTYEINQFTLNAYLNEYTKLKKVRKGEQL